MPTKMRRQSVNRREKSHRIEGPFSYVLKTTLNEQAWRALSLGAKALYVHLKARYIQHVGNAVYLSKRTAAEELGSSKNYIPRWFRELEYYGFIVKVSDHALGVEGKGKAARWRLTECWYGEEPPTRDFQNWGGEKYHEQKPLSYYKRKKRNPGPQLGAIERQPDGPIKVGHNLVAIPSTQKPSPPPKSPR